MENKDLPAASFPLETIIENPPYLGNTHVDVESGNYNCIIYFVFVQVQKRNINLSTATPANTGKGQISHIDTGLCKIPNDA